MPQPQDQRVKATIVGSLPKPGWLAAPGELFPPWRLEGDRLSEGQDDAVRVWVATQDRAGLDCITDGEQRRRHYIWGFFQGLDGIDTINLGMRAQRGQRYHKEIAAARLIGGPEYRGPIFVDALRATLALTDSPVKVTLPGPMTIVDSLVDTIGGRSEAQLAMRFAELLNLEARALSEAGAAVIQFDEPCFNVYIDKVRDWGIAALERAAEGVAAKKAVHICYGYGTADVKRWKSANQDWSHYAATLPLLAKSSIDQVSVETAASGVDVAVIEALRGKDVLLGVVDVGSESVESPETVAERLHAALRYTDPGHLYACTDCGMLPLSRRAAEGKLHALAAGAALVNGSQ
ncbi:MAG TPA: methionine synthase [Acetobacteraceae bacterium]|jgi:5-methyltetrahydropteroyltriglutamate--homocysteine methyltransferase|nr:methionine synthase [Acetobacteraceae bacterium]